MQLLLCLSRTWRRCLPEPRVFILKPQTLHALLCRSIASFMWSVDTAGQMLSRSFVPFSNLILYKIDFNQKRKDIVPVHPPETAFLLGKTGTSMLVQSWGCFFQTTLLRIQFRAILLLHWVIWIKKRTVFSHQTRMINKSHQTLFRVMG